MSPVTGGCRCGAVRFSLNAEPVAVRACWCRDCQYWGAGAATVNAVFRKAALSVQGDVRAYESLADSGAVMHRSFCPVCGTPLFSESSGRPDAIVVRAGALDHPGAAPPTSAIWMASAPAWACTLADLPSIPGQPGAVPV